MQRVRNIFGLLVLAVVALTGQCLAATYTLNNGEVISGDPISYDENGVAFRLDDGSYSPRVPWGRFSQVDLKKFMENDKAVEFVEPFIELTEEEKQRRTAIVIKEVDRLARPTDGSLLGAMFGSGVGLVSLLLLYAANLYAAWEISIYRARSPGLVCGLAAIPGIGLVSNIVFLSMPTQMESPEDAEPEPDPSEMYALPSMPGVVAAKEAAAEAQAHSAAVAAGRSKPKLPPAETFKRGQFTFNRRFFETRFARFFGVARSEEDKKMILIVKSARGQHTANRITRVSANEVFFQIEKGAATAEVNIPFADIQEIVMKPRDA